MSVVAVQSSPLLGIHSPFRQNRHAVAPIQRTPGIISLSKPLTPQRSPRPRKPTPAPTTPSATPKEKAKKPRSRPTSEDEHDKRGRRTQEKQAQQQTQEKSPGSPKARRPRQTPSPVDAQPEARPEQRLTKQRRGLTKSTPALCAAVSGSAPVPVPQLTSSHPHPSGLSRSAPLATPMSQSIPARMRRTLTNGPPSPPKEPPSPSPRSKAPLTAPLNGAFPRRHSRTPSEALFNLSLDDDDEPQEIPVLFRPRAGDKVYAGGRFQNGPDPTMLPAPSFLSGF